MLFPSLDLPSNPWDEQTLIMCLVISYLCIAPE